MTRTTSATLLLVEQPNGDYAATIVRQFYFDAWYSLLLRQLTTSADARIAEIAEKAVTEVTYHVRRSSDLMVRLGDSTDESHRRMQTAVDDLWSFTGEMFATDTVEERLAAQSITPNPATLREPWLQHVSQVFRAATLTLPSDAWMQQGGKQGRHTEHLGYLLAEMQFLQRTYPGAKW